jgi:antitoxin ParD1/3/4
MSTMNISLPEDLRDFVESYVVAEGYSSSSEYVRELIRKDRQRARLRALIMAGIEDPVTHEVSDAFWAERSARLDAKR